MIAAEVFEPIDHESVVDVVVVVVGGLGSDSGLPVANCCGDVNDVSSPNPNGTSVTTAPTVKPR